MVLSIARQVEDSTFQQYTAFVDRPELKFRVDYNRLLMKQSTVGNTIQNRPVQSTSSTSSELGPPSNSGSTLRTARYVRLNPNGVLAALYGRRRYTAGNSCQQCPDRGGFMKYKRHLTFFLPAGPLKFIVVDISGSHTGKRKGNQYVINDTDPSLNEMQSVSNANTSLSYAAKVPLDNGYFLMSFRHSYWRTRVLSSLLSFSRNYASTSSSNCWLGQRIIRNQMIMPNIVTRSLSHEWITTNQTIKRVGTTMSNYWLVRTIRK